MDGSNIEKCDDPKIKTTIFALLFINRFYYLALVTQKNSFLIVLSSAFHQINFLEKYVNASVY